MDLQVAEGFRVEEAPHKHNLYKYQQWMTQAREVTKARLKHESDSPKSTLYSVKRDLV